MTASDTTAHQSTAHQSTAQRDLAAARSATTAAGKAITDATAKVAKTTIDATLEANRTVTAAAAKALTAAGARNAEPDSFVPAYENAKKQTEDVVGTLTAQTKELGLAWLDAYDGAFAAALELNRTMISAIRVEALAGLAHSGTQVMADLNSSYSHAVRDLLK